MYFGSNVEAVVTGPHVVVWKLELDLAIDPESWR